jgi:hypothetical protein
MGLSVRLSAVRPVGVFGKEVTHNLAPMAYEAKIYDCLWNPGEMGITKAGQLIGPLTAGLALLEGEPARFRELNPENKWGSYEGFVEFVRAYLEACTENPDADVKVSG